MGGVLVWVDAVVLDSAAWRTVCLGADGGAALDVFWMTEAGADLDTGGGDGLECAALVVEL